VSTEGDTPPRDLAQHFTPPDVARLVWRLVEGLAPVRRGTWTVADPSAGEGALLRAAGARGRVQLAGLEIDAELAARARAAGLGVRCGDGLIDSPGSALEGACDAVVGNPPYGRCSRVLNDAQIAAVLAADEYSIWHGPRARRQTEARLRAAAVEHLFLERALQLVRPGGLVVYVLPEGLFSNSRTQLVRDWILARAEVLAVVALPARVFRRPGLHAKAALLALRRRPTNRRRARPASMVCPTADAGSKAAVLEQLLDTTLALQRAPDRRGDGVAVPASSLAGARWDAAYWLNDPTPELERCPHPLAPLGDSVELLTYGPIVTGRRPQPLDEGVRVIGQGDFSDVGLCPKPRLLVRAGSVYDPPRSRVRPGDLLLPRSGAGSLGRNRMAVYDAPDRANIGCFVNLVRLRDLNPYYVWAYFRTPVGWAQIRRLINGSGVPNISFAEIRSLRIPRIGTEVQARVEARYRREVSLLRQAAAAIAFGRLVDDLARYVSGESDLPAGKPVR